MPAMISGTSDVIFVVDDDPDFKSALGDLLSEAGYRPILFARAESLLASLALTLPAAIVTDVAMPGLSGVELVGVLAANKGWRSIPVVVMTGDTDTALPLRLAVPIVYKPDVPGLISAIQDALCRPNIGSTPADGEPGCGNVPLDPMLPMTGPARSSNARSVLLPFRSARAQSYRRSE